eukprot:159278-Rhodomonas_salina.1
MWGTYFSDREADFRCSSDSHDSSDSGVCSPQTVFWVVHLQDERLYSGSKEAIMQAAAQANISHSVQSSFLAGMLSLFLTRDSHQDEDDDDMMMEGMDGGGDKKKGGKRCKQATIKGPWAKDEDNVVIHL